MNKNETIAITGHRIYPDRAALYRGLDQLDASRYLFGGAKGVDSDALEYIAKTQPNSIRTVVVPNRLIDQPKSAQVAIAKYANNIVELRNSGNNRYFIRNRYLVDHSNRTVAFYDFRNKGGTFRTIQYARTKGKLGRVFPLREFSFNEFSRMSKNRFHRWLREMKSLKVNVSSIKTIVFQMIFQVFGMTVQTFFESLGYVGLRTIESFFH